jgi:flagellar motor switch protein FliM
MAIASLDFSQPAKFTSDIRRRMAGAVESFCEATSARMTRELNVEAELSVVDISQHTWAQAKARLPADAVAMAVREGSSARQLLVSVERSLVLQALECMLGGDPALASPERHLTELDWTLAGGLLDAIVEELSGAWQELGGAALERGGLDAEGDAGVEVGLEEPTLVVALSSSIAGQASTMSLLIPWHTVEPFADGLRAGGSHHETHVIAVNEPEALRRGVAGAQVLLRVEVGSVQMGIESMLTLAPGALVQLDGRAEDGVRLFAEGTSLGRGRPGRSGVRRAVKLESIDEAPAQADTYARIGRAELERARAHVEGASGDADGGKILSSIFVRVWAELGRTHLPIGEALELAAGAVVELDQLIEAPVELFANGRCFANGGLVVTADGAWGIQLQQRV